MKHNILYWFEIKIIFSFIKKDTFNVCDRCVLIYK